MPKLPNYCHEANVAGLAQSQPKPRSKPHAPNNHPSMSQVLALYERAKTEGDQVAMDAAIDAYEEIIQREGH